MGTIRLTYADYARLMPLLSGEVKPDGLELELVLGRSGSWVDRADMLRRALHDEGVQGGEASMGVHLKRIDAGDRSFVALPVFGLRNFTARDLYVRQGSSLTDVAGLAGKRVGMYSWTASGSIWYRHFLQWCGVAPGAITWVIGDVDAAFSAPRSEPDLPANVSMAPPGQSLSDLLVDGHLDAIYSPPRPAHYHPVHGPIARLYPDSREIETAYFQATAMFPPQHLVVLRRAVWEADPSIARRLTDAFVACEEAFRSSVRSFPYVSPWLDQDLERAETTLGPNLYAHGIEANRATLEAFAEQGFKLGLTRQRVAIEDYFQEFLAS